MQFALVDFEELGDLFLIISAFLVFYKVGIQKEGYKDVSVSSLFLWVLAYISRTIDFTHGTETAHFLFIKYTYVICTLISIVIYLMKAEKSTEIVADRYRIDMLILPALIIALYVNYGSEKTRSSILNTFSLYLEAVAIVPQNVFTSKLKRADLINFVNISVMMISKAAYACSYRNTHAEDMKSQFINLGLVMSLSMSVAMIMYIDHFMRLLYITFKPVEEDDQSMSLAEKLKYFISREIPPERFA